MQSETLPEEIRDCGVLQISHEWDPDITYVVWSHHRSEVMTVCDYDHYYKAFCLQSPVHIAKRMENSPHNQIPVQNKKKQFLLHCSQ